MERLNTKYHGLPLVQNLLLHIFPFFVKEIETNFLDDVFFTWTNGKEKLEEFLKDFSNYHPNIKFTYEFNKENIPFLDLNVSFSGGQLTTDLHIKSTDKHQYLHYVSARSDHTKRVAA